jgi:hypothetical protein
LFCFLEGLTFLVNTSLFWSWLVSDKPDIRYIK